jgi:4-hydroxy-2-oxoglutarate aldolase
MAAAGLGARRSALGGVMAPETTPFDANGEVDGAGFMANVRIHIADGLHGIVTSGSTGEAPLLGDDERMRLVELARALVPEERWLIAGVGAESTRAAIWRARDAAARGADAVLVVAPHYYGGSMTDEALAAHYSMVADAATIPVILYNIPKYAHFSLSAPLVARLSKHGNIIGIKDSSGDLEILRGFMDSQSEAFTVLTGSGGTLLPALEMGARGGILGVACFAARTSLEVYEGHERHDRTKAGDAQVKLIPLAREIVGALGPAGVKAAMDVVGLWGGTVRSPLPQLTQREVLAVRALMKAEA